MNVRLLRKIQKVIARNPKEFDMDEFDCGTAACLAGYCLRMTGRAIEDAVGINDSQTGRLIFTHGWPEKYCNAYRKSKTGAGRVRAAIRRIDHFIKTKGAE